MAVTITRLGESNDIKIVAMNVFEEFTLLIGALAILWEVIQSIVKWKRKQGV